MTIETLFMIWVVGVIIAIPLAIHTINLWLTDNHGLGPLGRIIMHHSATALLCIYSFAFIAIWLALFISRLWSSAGRCIPVRPQDDQTLLGLNITYSHPYGGWAIFLYQGTSMVVVALELDDYPHENLVSRGWIIRQVDGLGVIDRMRLFCLVDKEFFLYLWRHINSDADTNLDSLEQ